MIPTLDDLDAGAGESVGCKPAAAAAALPTGARGGGWVETKLIHGRAYNYWRWREGGRLRSKYLGPAGGEHE
jgi:hypothetical protein